MSDSHTDSPVEAFLAERKDRADESRIVHSTVVLESLQPSSTAEEPKWTLWTERRVYFPCYWELGMTVESVPRDPCNEEVSLNA